MFALSVPSSLKRLNMLHTNSVSTPTEKSTNQSWWRWECENDGNDIENDEGDECEEGEVKNVKNYPYRELVGSRVSNTIVYKYSNNQVKNAIDNEFF